MRAEIFYLTNWCFLIIIMIEGNAAERLRLNNFYLKVTVTLASGRLLSFCIDYVRSDYKNQKCDNQILHGLTPFRGLSVTVHDFRRLQTLPLSSAIISQHPSVCNTFHFLLSNIAIYDFDGFLPPRERGGFFVFSCVVM